MGLIDRFLRVTSARIDAFLDHVEDPAAIIPQLIAELDDKYRITEQAEAKARAAVSGAQRRADEAAGKVLRLERGAALAVQQGRDDLARDALAAQMQVEELQRKELEALARAEAALTDARTARLQMRRQLDDLKERQRDLMVRASTARIHRQVQRSAEPLPETRGLSLLDQIARMEAKVDVKEAEHEGHRDAAGGQGRSLDERLRGLEQQAEVDQRLAALRRRPEDDKTSG